MVVASDNEMRKEIDARQEKITGKEKGKPIITTVQKILGRINGKHIIQSIVGGNTPETLSSSYYPQCLYMKKASEIMEKIPQGQIIGVDSTLIDVLDVFRKTRFAFTPIVEKVKNNYDLRYDLPVGSITIRDFLECFSGPRKYDSNKNIIENNKHKNKKNYVNIEKIKNKPIKEISSDLISVEDDSILKDAIFTMMNKGIRNLGITDNKSNIVGVINDRNILEFLLKPKTRMIDGSKYSSVYIDTHSSEKVVENDDIVGNISIKKNVDVCHIYEINEDTTVRKAAVLLMDCRRPYLILKGRNKIVTPWDIVMKTLSV